MKTGTKIAIGVAVAYLVTGFAVWRRRQEAASAACQAQIRWVPDSNTPNAPVYCENASPFAIVTWLPEIVLQAANVG